MTSGSADPRRTFMTLALREAEAGARSLRGGPFGAVVVRDGVVLARASNGVVAGNDPTAHAEVEAIRLACRALQSFRLDGCEVYASCEPCPMCLFALCWARPHAVYFAATRAEAAAAGFDDARLYDACRIDVATLPLVCERLEHPDAARPFAVYADLAGRTPY